MSGRRLQSPKGMRDLLPADTAVWTAVETEARSVFAAYGYGEIRTPLVEDVELFERSVGEETDIVGKEMYTFDDRKGRRLALRPEGTAGVARAFVQHGLESRGLPSKLFYIGPFFRYERPQKGRYRQFSQIGAELIGDAGPTSDGELLLMLVRFLKRLQFPDLTVLLNTVGDRDSRAAYRRALTDWLAPRANELSDDSRRRLDTNPLRILDSKHPDDLELLSDAPRLDDHLNDDCAAHFAGVRAVLDAAAVPYRVEPRLVRGLDYYSRTVFEIVSSGLGAQDAIVGGGRYDGLIEALGGRPVPGIGFAIGQDRLVDVLPPSFVEANSAPPPVHLVAAGDVAGHQLLQIAEQLRSEDVAVVAELGDRSVKAALRRADRSGARWVLVAGEAELKEEKISLRDLRAGEQETMSISAAAAAIKERSE